MMTEPSATTAFSAALPLKLNLTIDAATTRHMQTVKKASAPAGAKNQSAHPSTASDDEWLGRDKAKHAAVSAALGCAAGASLESRPLAYVMAVILPVGKEIWDKHHLGHSASVKDLVADAVGVVAGLETCRALRQQFDGHFAQAARKEPKQTLLITPKSITYKREF